MKKRNSFKKNFVKGFLFVFCAVPGLVIFMSSSLWIMIPIFSPGMEYPPVLSAILLMVAGGVLILIGTGKLKEPKHIVIFLFIPISLIFYFYLEKWGILGGETIGLVLFIAVILYLLSYLTKAHYQKKRAREGDRNGGE